MTPEEVNKFLAIECMGWRRCSRFGWLTKPDSEMSIRDYLTDKDWNPYHSIGDAMRVVEHLRAKVHDDGTVSAIRMSTGGRHWTVMIDDCDAINDSLSAAISLAAVEWARAKRGGAV